MQIQLSYQYIFIMKATILDTHGRIGYGLGWEKFTLETCFFLSPTSCLTQRMTEEKTFSSMSTLSNVLEINSSTCKQNKDRFKPVSWPQMNFSGPWEIVFAFWQNFQFQLFKKLNLPSKFTYPNTAGDFLDRDQLGTTLPQP